MPSGMLGLTTRKMNAGAPLEESVKAIESATLGNSQLNGRTIVIDINKTVILDGVRHEIDLYVQIKSTLGYDSLYIFECKDWAKSVGKNEVVAFSEKIKVTGAAKGFLVAKSFGRYAEAQAALDCRISLLTFSAFPVFKGPFATIAVQRANY